MYGKAFSRMYTGSMMGAGEHVFAVWNYAIATAQNSRMELNPKLLAVVIGSTEERMTEAIEFLQQPDPLSTHKECDGRRLVREGQFQYFMPQWKVYQEIKSREHLRESNRLRQQRHRTKSQPMVLERAVANGHMTQEQAEREIEESKVSTKELNDQNSSGD